MYWTMMHKIILYLFWTFNQRTAFMFCAVLSLMLILCLLLSSNVQTERRERYGGEEKKKREGGMGMTMWEEEGSREKDYAVHRWWRARFEPDKRLKRRKRWRASSNQDEMGEESWELWGGGWRRLSLPLWGERSRMCKRVGKTNRTSLML